MIDNYDAEAAHADLLARLKTASREPVLTVDAASDILWGIGVDSHARLAVMMNLIAFRPAEQCWPIVLRHWPSCDLTGDLAADLIDAMEVWNDDAPMVGFLDEDAAAFFHALPEQVTVYRGGNEGSWLTEGISWSTDRKVALGFAHGHRGLRNREPRIASGRLRKADILAVFVDRQEREILTAPRFVYDLTVEDVTEELAAP